MKVSQNTRNYDDIKMFDVMNYPFFFGIALLNFEGNPATLNVQASMRHPKSFKSMYTACAIFVSILVMHVASLSYVAYGSEIKDLVTLNLPHNEFTTMVRMLYWFGLLGSFPLQMFPWLDIIENYEWYK